MGYLIMSDVIEKTSSSNRRNSKGRSFILSTELLVMKKWVSLFDGGKLRRRNGTEI